MVNDSEAERLRTPNKIAGPNAGGPRQLPIRTPRAARVGRFRLLCSPWNKKMSLYATLWKLKSRGTVITTPAATGSPSPPRGFRRTIGWLRRYTHRRGREAAF